MIPLRLELRGFTCFIGTTVVDFEALEVDLFAIAGPTGAGKSTLLDGLTYLSLIHISEPTRPY